MLSEKLRIIFQDYWNPSTIKMYIDEIFDWNRYIFYQIIDEMDFKKVWWSDFVWFPHYQKDKWKDVPLSYATAFYKYLISRLTHA